MNFGNVGLVPGTVPLKVKKKMKKPLVPTTWIPPHNETSTETGHQRVRSCDATVVLSLIHI